MNQKQERSLLAINQALERLIKKQDYSSISVSDIIAESGVARSTFYSHCKNKDDVLIGIVDRIFHHVFSHHLDVEAGHDFSSSPAFSYDKIVIHTFCHFQEDRELIGAIFSSSASHLFTEALKEKAAPLMEAIYNMSPPFSKEVPKEVGLSLLLGAFVDLLRAFTVNKRDETPEEMASYFFAIRFPRQ